MILFLLVSLFSCLDQAAVSLRTVTFYYLYSCSCKKPLPVFCPSCPPRTIFLRRGWDDTWIASLDSRTSMIAQYDIQTDQVAQSQRSHGMVCTQLHSGIDIFYACNAICIDTNCFVDHMGTGFWFTTKPAAFIYLYRSLADLNGDCF